MSSTTATSRAGVARGRWIALVVAGLLGVASIALALYFLSSYWLPLAGWRASEDAEPESSATVEQPMEVVLTPEKISEAKIETAKAQMRPIATSRTFPAKLDYNHNYHLEVRSPCAGVVKKVHVQPGQKLDAGAPLATITSNEIGLARDQLKASEAALELAKKELAYREQIASSVDEALGYFNSRPHVGELEKRFAGRTLGKYRETVFSTYSKLRLAETADTSSANLSGPGVISGRLADERRSAREVASAAFDAACELARFESRQDRDQAAANVSHHDRLKSVSEQHLASLVGPLATLEAAAADGSLSELVLRAPFDGTIEDRIISDAERIAIGQSIFVLANTERLWVLVEIRERDWKQIAIAPGESIQVRTAAGAGSDAFVATVRHFGGTVSADTRAISLVAEIDNGQHRLKPGMFGWVTVPAGAESPALVVPAAAIMRQDEHPFVFVPQGTGAYRRVDVELGRETGEWVEILAGLKVGDAVISRGAFFLKSELLLEREE